MDKKETGLKPNRDNGFVPDPLAQKRAAVVKEVIRVLDDKEIRDHVFRELYERQREALRSLKSPDANKTRPLPYSSAQNLTREAKQKALAILKAEINQLFGEIRANEKTATKLMSNAVLYAKRIGDHLLYVKSIVGDGHYEEWVAKHFDGGLSTVRVYTRIASYQNWKRIATRLHGGRMTIAEAYALLRRQPKPKPDARRENCIGILVSRFRGLVARWPDEPIIQLAHDLAVMSRLEDAAKARYKELRKKQPRTDAS
jgi:hypothetical protein